MTDALKAAERMIAPATRTAESDAEFYRDGVLVAKALIAAQQENTALRAIAAKIMPCHFCGVDDISKCQHGFPGCALADDIFCGEEQIVEEYRKLKTQLDAAQPVIEACVGRYMDNFSTPPQEFHYCRLCGDGTDDVPVTAPIAHTDDCPIAACHKAVNGG